MRQPDWQTADGAVRLLSRVPIALSEDSAWPRGSTCEVVHVYETGDCEVQGPNGDVGSFASRDLAHWFTKVQP